MNALIFIIQAIGSLYLFALLLRFWLPLLQADFRNPIAQAILKITSPPIIPLRRLLPAIGRIDTATVLVAFAYQYLLLWIIFLLQKQAPDIAALAMLSAIQLVIMSLQLFTFAIFISIIMSWLAPGNYNPAIALVNSLSEPLLRPFRGLIPSLGGIDITPMIVIILLQASVILIRDLM